MHARHRSYRHRRHFHRNGIRGTEWLDRGNRPDSVAAVAQMLAEHSQLAVAHHSKRVRYKFAWTRCWQPLDGLALPLRVNEVFDRLLDDADVPMIVLDPRPHAAAHQVPGHPDDKPQHTFVTRSCIERLPAAN